MYSQELADALKRIAALEAELQAARKDAERYRWLRKYLIEVTDMDTERMVMSGDSDGLDYLIDAALSRKATP